MQYMVTVFLLTLKEEQTRINCDIYEFCGGHYGDNQLSEHGYKYHRGAWNRRSLGIVRTMDDINGT